MRQRSLFRWRTRARAAAASKLSLRWWLSLRAQVESWLCDFFQGPPPIVQRCLALFSRLTTLRGMQRGSVGLIALTRVVVLIAPRQGSLRVSSSISSLSKSSSTVKLAEVEQVAYPLPPLQTLAVVHEGSL